MPERKLAKSLSMFYKTYCYNFFRYPVYIRNHTRPNGYNTHRVDSTLGLRRLFTGRYCTDEICCLARIDLPTLDQIIEDDPNVAVIWR